MKAIVVGASGVTRELTRRLGPIWDVTVVDPDPGRLDGARQAGAIATLQGDGSSRVTLRRAGLGEADAVVAATLDDDVNLEVCRLARQAGCLRVVALAAAPERLADYRCMGVEAHLVTLGARDLEALLDPEVVSSTTLAAGHSEAVEFRIGAGSPVKGLRLRDMGNAPWLVASILRGDCLIVPHGNTVLEEGDAVTVVGDASDYPRILRAFLATEARFPLEWGRGVAVSLDGTDDVAMVFEALALARATSAAVTVVVHRSADTARDEAHAAEIAAAAEIVEQMAEHVEVRWCPIPGPPSRSLASIVRDRSIGVVVLPSPRPGLLVRLRARRALRSVRLGRPVLFASGTPSYGRIVVPVEGEGAGRADGVAADLAAGGRLPLAALPRHLLVGTERRTPAEPGVPTDLIVLDWPTGGPGRWPSHLAAHLLARAGCSVLLVPER
ncbi:MAG: NAD-binding protein [Actinomycetota bacterium]